MKVKEIAFVAMPVINIAGARRFYEDLLGITPSRTFRKGRWIEFDVGGQTLAISNLSATWRPSARGVCVALEVEDFGGKIIALMGAHIKFVRAPFETPVCKMAVIQDPDGNTLMIHQRKPDS